MFKKAITTFIFVTLFVLNFALADEQKDFPTGERGANVTYLDAGGQGHPTGCIVSLTAGFPALAIAFNLFSNNVVTMMAAS